MKLNEEMKTVDKILAGVETGHSAELRLAGENIVLAKSFVKAAFFDMQQEMFFNNPEYSRHSTERMLARMRKFERALLAHQTAENKLAVLFSKIDPPEPGTMVRPKDLIDSNLEETEALREFDLGLDEPGH